MNNTENNKTNNKKKAAKAPAVKRMVLYARVSTQEQTKGNYPSCESQVEELEGFCQSRGWQAYEAIRDEAISAGSLKRPGLSRLRWLVQSGQVDGVLCTWYDRMTRSRDFYVLDKEFKTHNVEFLTLHDPTDRHTASGRFLETMLVAAKIRPKGTRSGSRPVKKFAPRCGCARRKGCGTAGWCRSVS